MFEVPMHISPAYDVNNIHTLIQATSTKPLGHSNIMSVNLKKLIKGQAHI